MTSTPADRLTDPSVTAPSLAERLAHVRWIAGGPAAGKSTLTRLLADRHDAAVLDGDRAEHRWLDRCDPGRHPRLAALRNRPPGDQWRGRTARQVFRAMPSLHGEMTGFLVEDLLALPADRTVLVDYFGILPRDLAPLLRHSGQAVFLLPTPAFRKEALTARYADPARARATWGDRDPESALADRLARDALWDDEVRRQAPLHAAAVLTVDGTTPAADLAERVAARFGLPRR
ncbi:hypothetical protein ABT093_11310 [Kitasatospora sp. NPDC002551]|uniref:hypothetical protein n=1 Tax=unclassified Kitasatospora TaxID=2633591 RepID=UPI00331FB5F3